MPARRRQATIIFDDGLRSNVRVAYPMLRALGIPATFFVCPGLIEERRWLWTHEARRRLQFAAPQVRHELARELGVSAEVEEFVQWMKQLDFTRRTRVEAMLRHATAAFVASEADREAFDLAGWDELRPLDPSIVTVGSHSMTHPVLPSMSAGEIEAELGESGVRRHYRAAVNSGSTARRDPHLMPNRHLKRGVLPLAWQLNHPPAH